MSDVTSAPAESQASGSAGSRSAAKRLPELCEELLSLAVQLRRVAEPPEESHLRKEVHRLLTEMERQAAQAGLPQGDVHGAKYALVALLDEIVLGSGWPFAEGWAGKPLQMELFNDFTAGEEFFRKLDAARGGRDPGAADLLEVFGLCLGLGFMGKHAGLQGMERLSSLRVEIAQEVSRLRGTTGAPLAPEGTPDRPLKAVVKNLPVWVVAAAGAGLLLLIFGICQWILSGSLGDFPSLED